MCAVAMGVLAGSLAGVGLSGAAGALWDRLTNRVDAHARFCVLRQAMHERWPR